MKYAETLDSYKNVAIILLAGDVGEGFLGVCELFDKGSFCLIEAESGTESSTLAQSFLGAGKAHLEININGIGDLLKIFFESPEEAKIFFDPSNQIVWKALSTQFEEHGLDLNTYKEDFIFSGVLKRCLSLGQNFNEYILSLKEDPVEISRLYDSFNFHSSEFFQNMPMYEEFREYFLPEIFEKKQIKIWVTACGTGEELISFALIIFHYLKENHLEKNYSLHAIDTNQNYFPKKFQFPVEKLSSIPKLYQQYLDIQGDFFFLKPSIKSTITFSYENLISGQIFSDFDLIICQNLLPHLKTHFQKYILGRMSVSLKEKGLFITEGETTLPQDLENFSEKGNMKLTFFELLKKGRISDYLTTDRIQASFNKVMNDAERIRKNRARLFQKSGQNLKKLETSLDQEKELLYLDEIDDLRKELDLTKNSLKAASLSFDKVFHEQMKSSTKLKKANSELSIFKDRLIRMVENRTDELKASNKDLKLANQELEENKKYLEKIQREKSLFFSKISHELRTPLNSILGFSDILLKKVDKNFPNIFFLESIYSSGKSLLNLLNSIHAFAKLDLGKLKVVKNKIPFIKFLNELSLYYKNECANKGLRFFLKLADNLPRWIESDEFRLKQVIENILNNALKFTEKGHIQVAVKAYFFEDKKDKVDLVFQIEDTGRGIEKEKVENLFKTFSQKHGTRLGLYISMQIAKKLGGDIGVNTQFGKGSTFTISLKEIPVLQDSDEKEANSSYTFFKDIVLIADDDPTNLSLFKAYLSTFDLSIETARDSNELIYKANKLDPGLIIIDLKMSIIMEKDSLNSLKQEEKKTPIILISTSTIEENIKNQFQGFLQKPVRQEDFIKEVSRFLKHETATTSFSLPEGLNSAELELLIDLKIGLQKGKETNEMNFIEGHAREFSEKIGETKLSHLKPWLDQLQLQASRFNIKATERLLQEGLDQLQKIKIRKAS